jgi:nitroreductase
MDRHHGSTALSALDVIFLRRSVRAYSPQQLDVSTIRGLLEAAVQAPTALHEEPWAFVVVQDRKLLTRYSDRAKGTWEEQSPAFQGFHIGPDAALSHAFLENVARQDFNVFYDAGTLIVICAKPVGPLAAADCWLAAQNLMLAATALGLGTCCIGSAIPVLNLPDVKLELGIPQDVEAVAPIVVGVPREVGEAVPRKDPQILFWTGANTPSARQPGP